MGAQGLGGRVKDFAAARRGFEAASVQDEPNAQYNLALLHARGCGGLSQNLAVAHDLCSRAIAKGQEQARAALPKLKELFCVLDATAMVTTPKMWDGDWEVVDDE